MNNSKVLGECFKAQFGEGYGFRALFEKLGKWFENQTDLFPYRFHLLNVIKLLIL